MVDTIHVLLVDDSPADAYLFKHRLAQADALSYQCTHVESLSLALDYLERIVVDTIILDLNLPDAADLEGLAILSKAVPHLPIIILSGIDDRELTDQALRAGAQDYLIKGKYTPLLLDRTLRYAIERNRNKQHLRQSEERLRTIIERVSDGIVIVDQQERILFANPAAEVMFGASVQELMGQPLVFPMQEATVFEVMLDNVGQAARAVEVHQVPFVWNQRVAVLLTLRDVTSRKALEQHLRAAKEEAEAVARFKTSLLQNVNHDLRTPLTAILGFAKELADNDLPTDIRQEFAGIIQEGSEQLLQTIESVLAYAELDAAMATPTFEEVFVEKAVRSLVMLLQPLAAEKGLELHVGLVRVDGPVTTDPVFLKRIVENLIGNAIKFTQRGGITVAVRSEPEALHIDVLDTGVGIDDAFLPHIFEEFRQELDGLSRHTKGSGLGLAITKKLTEMLGGSIGVVSEVGKGSTFTVTLPRQTKQI